MGFRDVVVKGVLRFGPRDFVFKVRTPVGAQLFEDSLNSPMTQAAVAQRAAQILASAITGLAPAVMPRGQGITIVSGYGPPTPVKLVTNSLYGIIGAPKVVRKHYPIYTPTPYRPQPPDPRWWRRRKAERRPPLLAVYWLGGTVRLALGRVPGGPKRLDPPPWWLSMNAANSTPGLVVNAQLVEELRRLGKVDNVDVAIWNGDVVEETRREASREALLRGRREPVRAPKAREAGGGRRARACGLDGRWRVSLGS